MARTFDDATGVINLALGNLAFAFGPGTIAAITFPTDVSTVNVISVGGTSSVGYRLLISTSGAHLGLSTDAVATAVGAAAVVTSKWQLLAGTKATGTVAPRLHIVYFDGTAPVHENSAVTEANSTVPTGQAQIGKRQGASAEFWGGDIHIVAVWDIVLTDAQIENLASGLGAWFAPKQPRGLWILDQDTTTQKVPDLSGGGANETTNTGTSISTTPGIWTPGGIVLIPTHAAPAAPTTLSPGSIVHSRALNTGTTVNPKLVPVSIVHTRSLGSFPVKVSLTTASIVHTRALGSPKVNPSLIPSSIVHTRALGSPTVSIVKLLSPASIVHARGLGSPTVNVTLKPLSIVHTRALASTIVVSPVSGTSTTGWAQRTYGAFRHTHAQRMFRPPLLHR